MEEFAPHKMAEIRARHSNAGVPDPEMVNIKYYIIASYSDECMIKHMQGTLQISIDIHIGYIFMSI